MTAQYTVQFTGRKVGAIGKFYTITLNFEAMHDATENQLRLRCYEQGYEHLSEFKVIGLVMSRNEAPQ